MLSLFTIILLSFCFFITSSFYTDVCDNVNCNYGQCSINQHDGTPYCICLAGYTGATCLDEIRVDEFSE